ncbi:zinc finger and BTB domain-containing protein 40 isoform X1 [Centrocercus urophasianus]|uniref:zinc finger and BTB domain-containing protein 40 isoform X1 n=1 Tax=Centrocercus urophasianus TaxID=9002 RepID=UPI001C64A3B5|nr:zinc finger and BTB domain-containing protein 40 isoform X1 [Centrocercus urophasianus]XP_042687532.1 zinc finger and BTB domain-containing protein 40 isoform X1 [Centrocercus urophasianus]XP_042687533.1 zinc finger and BTB domain-containing protein 40 isoform X1 [Centrocercus urophasianus]XP_042687534.1 zinc finger and BTB domain-containing protein 40 isoform X1 [Centrocercus urophasianus]XP_042687535.1 zinc finger and BTB domain-containing protein 40 isoform X1 [Centrocercus urophasianus]
MELPSYSKQLLQQLYTLCKEQQFCDCTIFVGTAHFRAHKVVLAAASLLFKSLLDSTDTISIDASVVTPEEFALLLEMMYTGKLPTGKHNFTKVIFVSDSLQMFDVAVSCKTLLRDLISCSTQDQVEVSAHAADSSGSSAEADNLPQSEKPAAEGKTDALHPSGPGEAEMEADISLPEQELTVNHTWLHQDVMLSSSGSLREDSGSGAAQPACPERGCCVEVEPAEPLEKKGRVSGLAAESKSCKLDFFLRYESVFSEALSDAQAVLRRLEECREIDASQREVVLTCLAEAGEQSVFMKLLSKVKDAHTLDAQTLVSLLKLFQDVNPKLRAALLEREQGSGEVLQQTESAQEGEMLTARLLGCKEELIQSVTQLSPIVEFLEAAEEGFLTAVEKRVVLNCCEGKSQREAMDNLLKKVEEEKTLKAESLVKLLRAVKASFPGLHLLLDNLEVKANVSDGKAKWSLEDYGAQLLRRYQERLVEHLTDTQTLLRGISAAESLAPADREAMEQIVKCETGSGGFISLVSAALEEQSLSVSVVWQLLLAVREAELPLNVLMEEIQKEPGAELFFQAVATSESTAIEIILRHSELISEAIKQRANMEGLAPGEAGLTEAVKELLSISAQKKSSEASLKAALSTAQEKSVPAIKICQLLCSVHESFPDLQPVMQELGHVGLLTEGSGEKPGIRKWKVNSESQVEALDKEEDKAGGAAIKEPKEPQGKASSKKNFICKACEKSFHFYCRLKVHMKRCRVARGKQIQCKECTEVKSTKKELEKHQLEVHGEVGMAKKKKKKRLPVTCDICGREFAHASGMQYHKLTEHFDEKPFSCEKCGAKFAANSTLKNHLRLHTGDRPFVCKHCLMTFMQASALAYHTKKKHSEGKMYACQYCDAVFAQSIELSRHVRTHTGDKPYVCRECGKGFRQANGLSIHLRSFHNIEDPYDCRKCRMSFATLQEHRKHIHEVHSREYHPCPDCSKVFSAPSLLERHMVTHVGGKPFSCGICNKAYQQLSGLWYHNRTHHPDVFAAQNHRSSKFSSLQCSSCDKTFSSTAAHRRHVKAEHSGVKFHDCEMCKEQFPTLALLQVHVKCQHSGALQHHVTTEHFKQAQSTFTCGLCGELFTSQGELEEHCSAEHPKVIFTEAQTTTAQIVQVIQTSEQGAAEHIISFDEAQLTGSQVFVTLPESQASQAGSELVTVSVEDLFDDKVTLICEETK